MARQAKPQVYNIAKLKAHLPELVERPSGGETIIVAHAGKPKARAWGRWHVAMLNYGSPAKERGGSKSSLTSTTLCRKT